MDYIYGVQADYEVPYQGFSREVLRQSHVEGLHGSYGSTRCP